MKNLIVLLIAILLGVGLYHIVAYDLEDFDPINIGMGIATTSHDGYWQDLQVSQSMGGLKEVLPALQQLTNDGFAIGIWLGNSQLHSINYYQEEDQLAVVHANTLLESQEKKIRLVQLSSPNINLLELPIYYLALKEKGIKVDQIIIGLPFASFQLSGIRPRLIEQLSKLPLKEMNLPEPMLAFYEASVGRVNDYNEDVRREYPQDKLENILISELEEHWKPYQYRGKIRSKIKVLPGQVYQSWFVKNYWLQGASSVIEENLSFLTYFFAIAQQDEMEVLIYQPPDPQKKSVRDYKEEEYLSFFQDLSALSNKYDHVRFTDLSQIVPDSLWGQNNRGWLDIFHFKGEGHKILGHQLASELMQEYEVQ